MVTGGVSPATFALKPVGAAPLAPTVTAAAIADAMVRRATMLLRSAVVTSVVFLATVLAGLVAATGMLPTLVPTAVPVMPVSSPLMGEAMPVMRTMAAVPVPAVHRMTVSAMGVSEARMAVMPRTSPVRVRVLRVRTVREALVCHPVRSTAPAVCARIAPPLAARPRSRALRRTRRTTTRFRLRRIIPTSVPRPFRALVAAASIEPRRALAAVLAAPAALLCGTPIVFASIALPRTILAA